VGSRLAHCGPSRGRGRGVRVHRLHGRVRRDLLLARPDYPTIPIAIYRFLSQPGALNYGQALAMATLLMAVVGVSIVIMERIRLPGVGEF